MDSSLTKGYFCLPPLLSSRRHHRRRQRRHHRRRQRRRGRCCCLRIFRLKLKTCRLSGVPWPFPGFWPGVGED